MDHTIPTPDSASSSGFDDTSTNDRRIITEHSPKGRPLFDAARAAQARDNAIDQVQRGADADVLAIIADAIRKVATARRTFTTDHVWAHVPAECRVTVDPRVIGAMMVAAAKEGIVERLPGVFIASDMICCHRRPKQVWRSLSWRATL